MALRSGAAGQKSLRVSHVWLYSKSTEKSIQFYRDILGFRVVSSFPDGALLNGGGVLLGIHREEGDRKGVPGGTLIVFQTNDIERSYKELQQKGVSFLKPNVESDFFGQVADFKDPDGHLLEIWQPPPKNS